MINWTDGVEGVGVKEVGVDERLDEIRRRPEGRGGEGVEVVEQIFPRRPSPILPCNSK